MLFDEYTNLKLMRALNEDAAPRPAPVGLNRSYSRTAPKATKYKQQTRVPSYFTRTPRPQSAGPWMGTDTSIPTATDAMYMPGAEAYADPRTQVSYANYKKVVDPLVDFNLGLFAGIPGQIVGQQTSNVLKNVTDKLSNKLQKSVGPLGIVGVGIANASPAIAGKIVASQLQNPTVAFNIKQMIKTDLARKYMGGGSMSDQELYDLAVDKMGLSPNAAELAVDAAQEIKRQIPVIGDDQNVSGLPSGAKVFGRDIPQVQDPAMKAISDKLPELAKMGIDPLDWATKLMGADEAAENMANIPARGRSSKTAGGYLIPGQQKGIY